MDKSSRKNRREILFEKHLDSIGKGLKETDIETGREDPEKELLRRLKLLISEPARSSEARMYGLKRLTKEIKQSSHWDLSRGSFEVLVDTIGSSGVGPIMKASEWLAPLVGMTIIMVEEGL